MPQLFFSLPSDFFISNNRLIYTNISLIIDIESDHNFEKINTVVLKKIGDDSIFFLDESNLSFIVNYCLSNKIKLICFDLKRLLKILLNNEINIRYDQLEYFVDCKIELYEKYNKEFELDSNSIHEVFKYSLKDDFKFFKDIIEEDSIPFNIIPANKIVKFCSDKIIFIEKIYNFLSKDKEIDHQYLDKTKLYWASLTYSKIENNKIRLIDINKDLDKYFSGYKINEKRELFGKLDYKIASTKTGRTSSSYHTSNKQSIQKNMISRFGKKNGKILFLDFVSFEMRNLLVFLGFKPPEDVYEEIILSTCNIYNRDEVKENIISWTYGSQNFNEIIINEFDKMYKVKSYLEKIKEKINNNEYITFCNKKIIYEDTEDAKRKFINGEMQNFSTNIFYDILKYLLNSFEEKKLLSCIVATKYDEIVIDLFKEEASTIKDIFKNINYSKTFFNKDILIPAKIR